MAEKHRRARPVDGRRPIISVVGDHRPNNLIYGQAGRLTYVPPEDGGEQNGDGQAGQTSIGELYVNRMTASNFSLQELSNFRVWYPATKLPTVEDEHQAHKNLVWLWKRAPDALVGTVGPWGGLTKEFRTAASIKPFEARLPLLAYGEIADLSGRQPSTCFAFATAAGSLGHSLRIVRTQKKKLHWPQTRSTLVNLATAGATEEGHWCGNVPITQIKFAAPAGTATPLRWVLVQTDLATTMFEPILHREPVQTTHAACSYVSRGPSRISVSVKMEIRATDTGGESHCDVSFSPGLEGAASQLAIIDKAGGWSVWDVVFNPKAHKNKLRHSAKAKGNFSTGIPAKLPPAGVHGRRNLHRIAWLPVPHEAQTRQEGKLQQETATSAQSPTLLLCNDMFLTTLNVESREPLQILGVTRKNGVDALLDIQLCPTKSSRIFVLTTTTLFWLDMDLAETGTDPEPSIAGHDKTTTPNTRQTVLLSCPHLRDPADGSLKLCVAPSTVLGGRETALACIYSTKHAEMTVFWFAGPELRGQASFQQQLFRFSPPAGSRQQDRGGEQSMLMFPGEALEYPEAANSGSRSCQQFTAAGRCFFQFVALGPSLDLRSATCVSTPAFARGAVCLPTVMMNYIQGQHNIQEGEAEHPGSTFVVPDEVGDIPRKVWQMARPKARSLPQRIPERTFTVLNFSAVFRLLNGQVKKVAEAARQAACVVRGFENPTPLDVIRHVIRVGVESGKYPFTTLLDAVESNFIAGFGADLTDLSWARELADLDLAEERRVHIFDQVRTGAGHRRRPDRGVTTLYQMMSDLCEASEEVASVRRRGLVECAAVRLYFSLISMAVDTRQMARIDAATPLSREASPASSLGGWRPSDSRRGSVTDVEMSSSPPERVSWPPSSQDKGVGGWAIEDEDENEDKDQDKDQDKGQDKDQDDDDDNDDDDGEGEESEDPTVARLRQYAVSIRTEAPRTGGELRLLSHWKLGSDPAQFSWKPVGSRGGGVEEEEQKQAEEEARERRRKKNEKKDRRERERMARMAARTMARTMTDGASTPTAPRIQNSQALELPARSSPVRMMSSQAIMSSQPFSSQLFSSQAVPRSSQAIPSSQAFGGGGLFGHRPKKNKAKRAGGFK